MRPHTASPAPPPLLLLLLLLLLTPVARTTDPPPANTTLLFSAPGRGLRNCSCPAPVRDCDQALAESLCRCRNVPRPGARVPADGGPLAVWVTEPWLLEELLNRSSVGHLQLSLCGPGPLGSRHLALLGLRTLRIHSGAAGAPYPDQEIAISPASFDFRSPLRVTILDVAVLNGLSALKAYSVVGPPAPALSQHFPHLAIPLAPDGPDDPAGPGAPAAHPLRDLLVTFVY